jgi:hypothetical protein
MNNSNPKSNGGKAEEIIRAREKEKTDKSGPLYILNDELKAFLNLLHLPGSLNAAQAAALLGFRPHDIPVLVARDFLKPLGDPYPSCEKFFARVRIEELAADEEWLSRARAALNQHWRIKNASRPKPTIPLNRL